jgi:GntR family transcriptional regulator of vanillate catabolism
MALVLDRDTDKAGSQTVKAQLALRELVLSGAVAAGERLTEQGMVERLGVSRTPIRAALLLLAEEGLLEPLPNGGFTARAFSEREVLDSIEMRGALEGLAARFAAERGASPHALAQIRRGLDAIDAVVEEALTSLSAFSAYVDLNAAFHRQVAALADSGALERQIERVMTLPFASPSAFVMAQADMPGARTVLIVAQDQHRCILEAIAAREGARAEQVMREHSRLAARNLSRALRSGQALALVPGAALIRTVLDV